MSVKWAAALALCIFSMPEMWLRVVFKLGFVVWFISVPSFLSSFRWFCDWVYILENTSVSVRELRNHLCSWALFTLQRNSSAPTLQVCCIPDSSAVMQGDRHEFWHFESPGSNSSEAFNHVLNSNKKISKFWQFSLYDNFNFSVKFAQLRLCIVINGSTCLFSRADMYCVIMWHC